MDVDSEGDFAMGVNQMAKSTDVEIMGIASSEFTLSHVLVKGIAPVGFIHNNTIKLIDRRRVV